MIDFSEYFVMDLPDTNKRRTTKERLEFVMDVKSDADIIKKLKRQKNKSAYIKRLIRQDIRKGGTE